jgi:hypothetical protein
MSFDDGYNSFSSAFHNWFTPADNTGVGCDFAEAPARRDDEGLDICDFHIGRKETVRITSPNSVWTLYKQNSLLLVIKRFAVLAWRKFSV